ncbi:uncharacterized protein LOC142319577 isoform X2 [Lycorma delicatula]
MADAEVCLKWNTFHESILSSFGSLWEEEDLVDVTLAAGDQIVYAHKMILSACSPFFRKLFQETSCKHPVLILPGVNVNDLKMLLNFIYKGEVFIIEENLPKFLQLAEYLQIRGLWKPSSSQPVEGESSIKASEQNKTNNLCENPAGVELENDLQSTSIKQEELYLKDAPLSKRFRRNEPRNSYSTLSDYNTVVPSCKAEIKEFDNELYAVMDEHFGKSLLEWQKVNKPVLSESNKVSVSSSNANDEQDVQYSYMNLPYADLLPSPLTLQMWAQNRTLDQFACDLMKMLFSTEERIICNVNGKMGKLQFNVNKINLIRKVIQSFSDLSKTAFEEQWKVCVTKIDTANRGLKRRFKSKDIVFCNRNF